MADYVFEEEFRFEDENFKIKHDRPGEKLFLHILLHIFSQ